MQNQIEYKRVTKPYLLQMIVITILVFLVLALIVDWIFFAILTTGYMWLNLLYSYTLDKNVKTSISLPIYICLSACLLTILFFVLANLSMPLVFNLIVVIFLFISNVILGFYQLKSPHYVIEGKYYIEDAKKYGIKRLKILLLIMVGLLLISIILNLVLTIWKNSLI